MIAHDQCVSLHWISMVPPKIIVYSTSCCRRNPKNSPTSLHAIAAVHKLRSIWRLAPFGLPGAILAATNNALVQGEFGVSLLVCLLLFFLVAKLEQKRKKN